jgi:hypothetical protein
MRIAASVAGGSRRSRGSRKGRKSAMTAVHNLLLPFKRTRRLVGLVKFALFIALGGSFYGLSAYDLPIEVFLSMLGGLFLGLVALEAAPLISPKIDPADGLTFDRAGLTFTRKGRTVRWGWEEISDMKLRSPLHPLGLLLGTFLTFRVPPDQRRKAFGFASDRPVRRGSIMVIGNDYATWTHDIFAAMTFFKGVAEGAESPLGGPLEVGDARAPEPRWSFRKNRKKLQLWHVAGLVLWPAAGMAAGSLAIDGLPGSLDDLMPLLDAAPFYLVMALVGGPWLIVAALKRNAAQDNMLTLSAGGIGTSRHEERKQWLWWEISDIRVTQSISRGKDGAAACTVSFRAMQDGALPGRTVMEGKAAVPVSCTIEDEYEMPVEEIARQMNAWRDWYDKAFGHPEDNAEIARFVEEKIGPQPDGISIQRQKGEGRNKSLVEAAAEWLALAPMAAMAGLMIWLLRTDKILEFAAWGALPWWSAFAGLMLVGVGPLIAVQAFLSAGRNRIELDNDGLRLVRLGRAKHWRWSEIGPADLRRLRTKWSAKQRAVLTIEASSNGIGSAILRWAFNIDNRRLAVIEDIYDTSLDEIAEALNAHRRKRGGRIARQAAE